MLLTRVLPADGGVRSVPVQHLTPSGGCHGCAGALHHCAGVPVGRATAGA